MENISVLLKNAAALNDAAKEAKKAADTAKSALITAMKAAGVDSATYDGTRAIYKAYDRHALDTPRLRADLPEVWEEYGKITRVESVSFKAV